MLRLISLVGLLIASSALYWCLGRLRHAGYAVQIGDGDGFTFKRKVFPNIRIRIAWIDTPEFMQPDGLAARDALRQLISGKRLLLHRLDTDRYGRQVCQVWVGRRDVGLALLEQGLAWNYPGHSPGQSWISAHRYAKAQRKARKERIGLWKQQAPEPPWNYRHRSWWRKSFEHFHSHIPSASRRTTR